jgi:beta-lactamase regulating signal transducer with metallopeptidase domain
MNQFIDSLNSFAADWSTWLWRVCWQTAIVIAIAWVLCTLLSRSSPWLRSWIWRLAYVKILLVLVWTTPVNLPLLPPSEEPALAATATSHPTPTNASPATQSIDNPNSSSIAASTATTPNNAIAEVTAAPPSAYSPALSSTSEIATTPSNSEPPTLSSDLSAIAWLFLAWTTGAIAVTTWFAVETLRAFRLKHSARSIHSAELTKLVREVCNQLGLKQSVQLAESPLAGGPMLVKFARPLVVFPSGMLTSSSSGAPSQTILNPISPSTGDGRGEGEAQPCGGRQTAYAPTALTSDEIRLVLAHELAHLKRHDLAWNALSALLHTLLYFHPFIWIAHRCARQEQEMACDALVVTRLSVERHEYGQLLVKIVRSVGHQMNGAMATVAMSKSYQTLSRRIEAMKHVQKISRGRSLLLCSALAVTGVLAIIPWRVVAQDPNSPAGAAVQNDSKAQPPANAETETKSSMTRGSLAATPADKAAAEKLIGAWRAGAGSGKLTFNTDGAFTEFPNTLTRLLAGMTSVGSNAVAPETTLRGTWQIDDGQLRLTWKPTYARPLQRDFPLEICNSFRIAKLDSSLLRLTVLNEQSQPCDTVFLRRVETLALDKLKGKLPEDVLAVAALAGMDSQEAEVINKWMKSVPNATEKLKLIEEVAAAKNGKLKFAQLVKSTPAEDKAYTALRTLSRGQFTYLIWLADQGLLEEDEQKAVKRAELFAKEFNSLAYAINAPGFPKFAAGFGGGGTLNIQSIIPEQQSPVESEAALKLQGLIDGLGDWLFVGADSPLKGGEAIQPNSGEQKPW